MGYLRLTTACLLVAASSAVAQTGTPVSSDAPTAQPPLFRSGLDLVRVDVRVTDDEGRPIVDLRPDEIRIEEEGTARPIVLFQHVEAPQGTYSEAAQRTIAAQVSTNEGSPRGHIYVLVFDESHIVAGREQRARHAAEQFLRTHVHPGDRVALYALPGPGPQIEFTANVRHVIEQLTAVRGAAEVTGQGALGALAPMRTFEAYEITRGNQQILDRLTQEVSQNLLAADTRATNRQASAAVLDDSRENRRVLLEDARAMVARADGESRRFLLALADVVRTLRAVDGRKAVILFSEGFQIDNVTHELEDVAAAAAQSYSVIYAMDLNTRTIEASEQTARGGEQSSETRDRLQSLGTLTAATAGTLVPDAGPQLDRALARIAATTEDYYVAGFPPAHATAGERNGYRRIRVTVTRPGAHVSARTGYSLAPKVTPADRRHAIDAALRAPFAQHALKIEYTTYTLRSPSPGQQRVIVSLAADLPVASGDADAADVVYVVRDTATGKVAASGSDRMPLPRAVRDSGSTMGVGFYRVQLELPEGTYLMRALVREPGGLLGSADRRFQVRALSGPDVAASDLILGSADVDGLPVRAAAYVSDLLEGVFELYGRTAAQLEPVTVTTDMIPLEGGSAAVSTAAALRPVVAANGGVSRAARVELPLTGVPPGEYLVRATIRNGSEAITELLRDVTVRPGTRPSETRTDAARGFNPQDVLHGEIVVRLATVVQGRAAKASQPGDEAILRGLAAFARADYSAAIAAIRSAQDAGARDPALAFVLGWSHAAAGDDPAAITAWRAAIVGDPTLVPSYLALVDAYSRLGQPELARQVIDSGLRAMPASPELQDRLARLKEPR